MTVQVTFAEGNTKFPAEFDSGGSFDARFGEIHEVTVTDLPVYAGEYAVTPKVEAQTMPTKGCAMADDVTIKAIPIYEVSNASGGNTVYIAKEV